LNPVCPVKKTRRPAQVTLFTAPPLLHHCPTTALPLLPRRFPRPPKLIQVLLIPQRIHRLPESPMKESVHLILRHQPFNRFPLEHLRIVRHRVDRPRLQHKESSIDPPAFIRRLLLERINLGILQPQRPKPSHRLHTRQRHRLPMRLMELDGFADIHIRHPIPIRHAERLARIEVFPHLPQPPTRPRRIPRIHQRHPPGLRNRVMHRHLVRPHIERHIRHMHKVVRKELLDDISLVPATDHKIIDPMLGIDLQNMPENRPPPNLHHRLRPYRRLFRQPRPQSPRQNHSLHRAFPISLPTHI
jgi:hypothetical protein